MPPPSELESGRTKDYLTWWGERRTALLSPCRFMLTSDNDDSSTRGMLLGDDYRTDRFSENYYRHYHGERNVLDCSRCKSNGSRVHAFHVSHLSAIHRVEQGRNGTGCIFRFGAPSQWCCRCCVHFLIDWKRSALMGVQRSWLEAVHIAAKCIGFTFRMTNIAHACKKQLSYWYPFKEVFGDNRELIMYIKEALLSF